MTTHEQAANHAGNIHHNDVLAAVKQLHEAIETHNDAAKTSALAHIKELEHPYGKPIGDKTNGISD